MPKEGLFTVQIHWAAFYLFKINLPGFSRFQF
ncbi:hypothetical protein P872_24805 [Rhodonellum psychrophilum GCM71 = DSM 17998]|uniref:Uncharacterized protein n=1 Tax=Rhodonellum psychrophilum GCM71 = DSM 17998 TaxID=1123057 RepID=U5BVF9_9BACT|nr:hypothetical protein P872_24805 [Rhodonellum psychrophilum GCM71 = DSM 17998]